MRVLAITEDYPVLAGGYLYFIRVCGELRKKLDLTILACHGATETILDIESIRVGSGGKFDQFLFPISVVKFLLSRGRSYDVVLVNWGASQIFALITSKILRRPVVLMVYHVDTLSDRIRFAPSKMSSKMYAIFQYIATMSLLSHYNMILVANDMALEILSSKNDNVVNVGIAVCR